MKANLIFLIAFLLPFEGVGPSISGFIITPALVIGLLYGGLVFNFRLVSYVQLAIIMMLAAFLLTSLGRHPLSSYILSLLALGAVMFPISRPMQQRESYEAFSRGLKLGLIFTIGLVSVEIGSQLVGASAVYQSVTGVIRDSETIIRDHNYFISYYRPYAMTTEPAQLALYLVTAFVFQDVEKTAGLLRSLTVLTIIITGSVSGVLLLLIYLAVRSLSAMKPSQKISYRGIFTFGLATLIVSIAMSALWEKFFGVDGVYSKRIYSLVSAVLEGNLIGSEGSRANAYVALTSFWEQEGVMGLLFGIGYANYSKWVESTFHDYGVLSALARGDVNNILIVVTLSTGLFGTVFFFQVLRSMFHSNGAKLMSAIGVYAIGFMLLYGGLVSYFFWFSLFAVLSAQKFNSCER